MKRILAALATVVLGFAVIAGIGTYVAAAKNDPGLTSATSAGTFISPDGKTYSHFTLNLNIYPNSTFGGHHGAGGGAHPDWVSYGLAGENGEPLMEASTGTNFVVPAHSAVTVTIWQYDAGETITNDFFAKVRGTVGNTATLVERYDTKTHTNATEAKTITQIPSDGVGHTFTIHGLADAKNQVFVSVPLPMSNGDEVTAAEEVGGFTRFPTKMTFTIITGDEGEYVWNCEFPCGDGTIARFGSAMSTMSYMSGHWIVKGYNHD